MADSSGTASPRLSITIVNTNNRAFLEACLSSLYAVDHGTDFEVILVDNASTDGSAQAVKSQFPDVHVITNPYRRGFAANHNQAIRASRGEYILVLNEDTIVRPGALATMTEFLDDHPDVGAVGCRLENPDGSLQRSCYRFPSPFRALCENLLLVAAFPGAKTIGDYRDWPHDSVRYVDFVTGAAIMVRRLAIESIGLLDERFFLYAEESDWCLRMWRSGWKVAFTPLGTIVHYGGQSSVAMKDRQFCEFNRSHVKFFRKHYGLAGAAVQRAAMILGSVLRLVIWAVLSAIGGGRREQARANVRKWRRELRWWLGLGPRQGLAELAEASP